MQLILLALFILFCFTYLFVWLRNKIKPVRKDGTVRNTMAEAISISFKLLLLSIVILIGYGIWYYFDEKRTEEKEAKELYEAQLVNEKNLIDTWRSDEAILNIQPDKNFEYKAFAGADKNKSWTGTWELNTGVLFLYWNGSKENSWNYRIISIDKTEMKVERKETNSSGYTQTITTNYDRVK